MPKKVCVILGAGASHDVHDSGSVVKGIEWRPPLARDLFAIEEHPRYREILSNYPGADVLTQQLAPQCKFGTFNVETELRRLSEHTNFQVRQHYKQIPPYLRDLIWYSTNNYTASPSCYEQLAIKLLADEPHEVLFLVLNYDDLLEKALYRFDSSLTFNSMKNYVADGRNAKVVKLHGCINWFTRFRGSATSWYRYVEELDISNKPADDDILISSGLPAVFANEIEGRAIYPIITAPLAGKNPEDLVCPSEHLVAVQEFLSTCNKFLMIGTSGLDDDLLKFLNENIPAVSFSRPYLHVVGGSDAKTVVDRFRQGVSAFMKASVSTPPKIFENGFRDYVSQNDFQDFARLEF